MKGAVMPKLFPILAFILVTLASAAFAEDAQLAGLFRNDGVQGTLVISSLDGANGYVHNDARAAIAMLPGSTFKIPNTLIALDTWVITEKDTLKWDGRDRGVAAWNRDQTLESAFRSSCIWFYQELARRIGTSAYETWLARIGYGNARPTPVVTTFWLEGDLRISALEQIAFLKRLYHRQLPFKPASYEILKRLMTVERTSAYTVRAKSGWVGFGSASAPQLGWFVGYVETRKGVWFFALNMDMPRPGDAALRQKLVMASLKAKGIL